MKKPTTDPINWSILPKRPWRRKRDSRPVDQRLARNDKKLHRPKISRAQAPADMGDQYFHIRAWLIVRQDSAEPGQPWARAWWTISDLKSMCQNRFGWFRSTVKNKPQSSSSGKAIQYPIRDSSCSRSL